MTTQLCQIKEKDNLVELISPVFSFMLDTADLSVKHIENRLSGDILFFSG